MRYNSPNLDEDQGTSPVAESAADDNVWKDEPVRRTVIHAPVLASASELQESGETLIKAEPSATGDACRFMVNRFLFEGHSWHFPDFESADGSPLAEVLFSIEDMETALVNDSTLTVTRKDKSVVDWEPLAREVGAAIRQCLEAGKPLIAEKVIADMPPEETIREGIQKCIDAEVNPGVAGHGGKITLTGVAGNTVTIHMGGGCQGCSAADLTLKAGIHGAFRKAVPMVGAILDETDHAAGMNPYFS